MSKTLIDTLADAIETTRAHSRREKRTKAVRQSLATRRMMKGGRK